MAHWKRDLYAYTAVSQPSHQPKPRSPNIDVYIHVPYIDDEMSNICASYYLYYV